ncbi:hypothetical protein [Nannocystis punicea]|uniref:Uncharacterized protein n=1 Tax=Nannocystis punicea TaxID=2995304 RepID=A0ABY7H4K7_9BACT|nr:hypothetical protein [Nannocystis poenicansa]WAS94197.1 hypothetical protein O0S08_49375 [Nannocystis poenicansa]
MARRELPLCPVCGAWSPGPTPRCGHARDPRFTWQPRPWWDGLGEFLGAALFMLAAAVALIGVGPLLWSIFSDWPPRTLAEYFGVLGMLLVTGPTAMVGLGLLIMLPERYRGRAWLLVDLDPVPGDTVLGEVWVRRRAPVHGGVTRTIRTVITSHDCSDMSSKTAAWSTGEPRVVVAATLAGLAARGQIELSLHDTTGWTARPRDPPSPLRRSVVHVRRLPEKTAGLPRFEVRLLAGFAGGDDRELARELHLPLDSVSAEIGYSRNELPRSSWRGTGTPTAALREALLTAPPEFDDPALLAYHAALADPAVLADPASEPAPLAPPPALDDPAPIVAVLAAWQARDPERVGAVLDVVHKVVDELIPASVPTR